MYFTIILREVDYEDNQKEKKKTDGGTVYNK